MVGLVAVAFGVLGVVGGARIGGIRGASGSVRVVETNAAVPPGGCVRGGTLNIVAHEDDDLLFLSPDLIRDIRGGKLFERSS